MWPHQLCRAQHTLRLWPVVTSRVAIFIHEQQVLLICSLRYLLVDECCVITGDFSIVHAEHVDIYVFREFGVGIFIVGCTCFVFFVIFFSSLFRTGLLGLSSIGNWNGDALTVQLLLNFILESCHLGRSSDVDTALLFRPRPSPQIFLWAISLLCWVRLYLWVMSCLVKLSARLFFFVFFLILI